LFIALAISISAIRASIATNKAAMPG